jgi:hypothetical protein
MKVGDLRYKITMTTWAVPGKEQTLDELISLFESRGTVILQVDREGNRLLVGKAELA